MRTPSSNSPKRALRIRDAGLHKISVTTRVLVVGSVAAAGAFASMAAWAQPGRSKVIRTATPGVRSGLGTRASSATVPATAPLTTPPTAASDDGGDDNGGNYYLTPPSTTPVTAPAQTQDPGAQSSAPSDQYTPAPVVSGAS